MSEPIRNMLGFVLVPMPIATLGIVLFCLVRKRRPPFWPVFGLLSGLAITGFFTFWIAGLLELPCAYAFTIWRMPNARSVQGVPISKIIKDEGARRITDDYFADRCGYHDNIITLRLETPSNSTDYYFAYESKTCVVVPVTDAAAERFPELMPPGDKLVNVNELNENTNKLNGGTTWTYMGNNVIKIPANWFRMAVRSETKSGTK